MIIARPLTHWQPDTNAPRASCIDEENGVVAFAWLARISLGQSPCTPSTPNNFCQRDRRQTNDHLGSIIGDPVSWVQYK
jgi:hypothetical protein